MKPRWNTEDLFDDSDYDDYEYEEYHLSKRQSLLSIVSKFLAGLVIWTSLAFILGCIVAGFCLGVYFVIDAYLPELF